MPELPEVETTRRGIERHLRGRRISAALVHDRRLRWPVTARLDALLRGQRVLRVERRAKYLLLRLTRGCLILHLGMSGSLRVVPRASARRAHDHVELLLGARTALRFNDPRRFGCCLYTTADPLSHPLLRSLAPEPLAPGFDGRYLHEITRGRRVAIKSLLLNGRRESNRCDALTGTLDYSAGAGIVAESNPCSEYRETLDKMAVINNLGSRDSRFAHPPLASLSSTATVRA